MKTILIVDDMEEQRALIALVLEKKFRIIHASSGNEALNVLSMNNEIDLIVSDLEMPDGDGRFLLSSIHKYKKLPVIIVTGNNVITDEELKNVGAVSVLRKPYDVNSLLATINEFVV